MLGLLQIYQKRSRRCYPQRINVYGKTLQRIYTELLFQFFHRRIIDKRPFFQCRHIKMLSETLFHPFFISFRNDEFFRGK